MPDRLGQGQLAGLVVAGGIVAGATVQPMLARVWARIGEREVPGTAGL
jgi:uncharacterized protein YgbK (DUF1537 family)